MDLMLARTRDLSVVLTLAVFFLFGCGDSDDPSGPGGGSGPTDTQTVTASGGSFAFDGGEVTMVFPQGALSGDTEISVTPTENVPTDPNRVAGAAWDFGPDGLQFTSEVTLVLEYDPASVPTGVRESELGLYRASGNGWSPVGGGSVNPGANTVSGAISSFSVYGVLALAASQITVAPGSPTVVEGGTVQLSANVSASDGTPLPDRPVTWSSSNESAATVDSDGTVTGVAGGNATITARVDGGGPSATASVTVVASVGDVQVTPATSSINAGETVALTGTPVDGQGNPLDRPVTWSSSDDQIATVDSDGVVTGQGAGTATITAMSEGASGTASVTVADPVTEVVVSPADPTLTVGASQQLTATGFGATGNEVGGSASWSSSDEAIFTVAQDGTITAVGSGVATVTATIDGVQGTTSVTVALDVSGLEGTWVGQWNNTTFGSSGPASLTISIDEANQTMTFELDLGGSVFGGSDPPPSTFSGAYTATEVTVTGNSATFGDVTLTGDENGFSGSGQNVPAGSIDFVDFSGNATETQITLNYVIHFSAGGTANGNIVLNKQ